MAASIVQTARGTSTTTSVGATFGSATSSGHTLIAAVMENVTTGLVSITGFTLVKEGAFSGTAQSVSIWAKISDGTETTVTASGATGATQMRLHVYEYAGLTATVITDGSNTATSNVTNVSSLLSGSITTTNANDLIFVATAVGGSSTAQAYDTSFTMELADASAVRLFSGDRQVSSTGTYSTTGSWTTAARAGGAIAAFQMATSTGVSTGQGTVSNPVHPGAGPSSSGRFFQTPRDVQLHTTPVAPSSLIANADNEYRVVLSWTNNDIQPNSAVSYRVERSTSPTSGFSEIGSAAAGISYYIDLSASQRTTYFYRVKARNYYGDSSYANAFRLNLVTNPNFKTDVSSWAGYLTTVARTTSQFYSGSASMSSVDDGINGANVAYYNIDLITGQTYSVQMRVKGDIGLAVYMISRNNGTSGSFTLTGGWDLLTWTFTATTGPGSSVELHADYLPGVSHTNFIDNVMLEASSSVGSYFDGSTVGAVWTGTANESISAVTVTTLTVGSPWTAKIQGWISAGPPQSPIAEYTDGRTIDTLKPEYATVTNSGDVQESDAPGVGPYAFSPANGYSVKSYSNQQFITVSANATGFHALMSDVTGKQSAGITLLTNFVVNNGFTGIELDWEGYSSWSSADYVLYQTFLTNLRTSLNGSGKKLSIVGPPIGDTSVYTDLGQHYYQFRYEDIAPLVDYVCVLAYDYEFDYGGGSPVQPTAWAQAIVTWLISKVGWSNRNKIVVGMPSYGYHATTAGFNVTLDAYTQSTAYTGFSTATRDAGSNEMMWTNAGTSYVYQDVASLNAKRKTLEDMGVLNISVWYLGGNLWFNGRQEPVVSSTHTGSISNPVHPGSGPSNAGRFAQSSRAYSQPALPPSQSNSGFFMFF